MIRKLFLTTERCYSIDFHITTGFRYEVILLFFIKEIIIKNNNIDHSLMLNSTKQITTRHQTTDCKSFNTITFTLIPTTMKPKSSIYLIYYFVMYSHRF